jgi:outer membrane protein OmpA-like peptidoglycan-associated protein
MSDHYGSIAIKADPPVSPSGKQKKPARKRPAPDKNGKKKSNRPFIIALLAFFLIASYFLTGIYLVPQAIKKYLPQYIYNNSGLTLALEHVQFNPINFQLTLEQLTADVPEFSASEPLLQVQSLFIDLDLTSLVRSTFACDKLTIENLQLNLIRFKDRHYNIPDLSHFSDTQDQGEIINFASLPFLFSLNNIDINESRIVFEDQLTDKTHVIEELQLAIPTLSNFSFQSENYIQPHFSAIINGSPIQLSGKAVQLSDNQGFQTKLSCSIQSLDLVPYFSYLPPSFPLTMSNGQANTTLQISFAPNKQQGDRLSIDINMDAINIEMNGKKNDLQITIPTMKLDAVVAPLGKRFHIKDMITKETHLKGSKEQVSSALQKFFFPIRKQGTSPPAITIDRFLTDQGHVTFLRSDKKNKTSVSEWNELQVSIKDFNSATTSGTIHISGEHGKEKGAFSWQGTFIESGKIHGNLLLSEFPADTLFQQLLPESKDAVHGIATFSGDLAFQSDKQNSLSYSLGSAILQFHNLKLTRKKNTWLKADAVHFTRLSRSDDRYNLGNIFLKNATLAINSSDLPPLLKHLFTEREQKNPLIKGIDFAGTLNIKRNSKQKKPLTISDIRFQTNRLEKASTTENFAFSGHFAPDGIIQAKGILNLAPTQIQANLAFSDIDAKALAPSFAKWPLLLHSKTTLHGKGIYRFPEPSFQGDLRLSDSLLQNKPKTPLITWESAEFNSVSCRFAPFSLQTESLLLITPQVHWQRSSFSPFQHIQKGLQSLFRDFSEKETLFPIEIKKINFKNASVSILDKRISPAWSTTVNTLEGRISNLNSHGNDLSPFTMTGMVEDSPFEFSGAADLFSAELEAHARMKISGFPLRELDKQLKSVPVIHDIATLELQLKMTESLSQFNSNNEMSIKNLRATSANSNTALALAFLKDTNDTFSFNVSIDDSSRSLVKESIASFQTTVIKASYAPLLLDRRFKDLQDKEFISFQPGSNKIDKSGRETLTRYAELLNEHPGLRLLITGMADEKKDRPVLLKAQKELEQQRIDKVNDRGLVEYRKKQREMSAVQPGNTLKEEDIPKEDLAGYTPLLPNPVHISDDELLELAKERSLIVYDYCAHSLDITPQRLTIKNRPILSGDTLSNGARIDIKTLINTVH